MFKNKKIFWVYKYTKEIEKHENRYKILRKDNTAIIKGDMLNK